MYNCELCGATSAPHEPLRRHVIYRHVPHRPARLNKTRTEIAREVPVCEACALFLGSARLRRAPQRIEGVGLNGVAPPTGKRA